MVIDIPSTSKSALADDGGCDRRVRSGEAAVVQVASVVVCEGCIRALPCDDAAAATAEEDITTLYPESAET